MHLLTDAPDDVQALAPAGVALERTSPRDLPPPERRLWSALAASSEPWLGELPAGLVGLPGPVVVVHDAPRSQLDVLDELSAADAGVPDGTTCVALAGSRFRGQRGRSWSTSRGNLHASVHLAFDVDAAGSQAALAVLPAVAAAEAIEEIAEGRVRPRLKWVNDLLLEGRKVGGVLTSTQVQSGRVRDVRVGIGMNLTYAPEIAPAGGTLPAGRLADADGVFATPDAWAVLLPALTRHLAHGRDAVASGNGALLVDRYRERAAFLGRHVTIWPVGDESDRHQPAQTPIAQGRVLELRSDLSLILEGVGQPIRTGRMTIDG
ncbi:MAG: hypothetical protein U5J97_02865 [Trueperaceae bacterium]|nr:hypothetical protein [Trueperaceae bacterium]